MIKHNIFIYFLKRVENGSFEKLGSIICKNLSNYGAL